MPKKRERCTNKAAWTIETMKTAFRAVSLGTSIRQSPRQFNISFSTLKDRVKAVKSYAPSLGVFSEEQENETEEDKREAGKDWFYGFLRRHPKLSLRKPEAKGVNRILAFNEDEIQRAYSNLESLFSKFNFPATRIYNVDETEVSTLHIPSRIIASKGTTQVSAITSWERGKNITVCCAVSAAGHYIPPMFIFPHQRMSPQLRVMDLQENCALKMGG
ncbi:hypothetical protein ANN_08995 [Periplaneta americana]|uniref:HTH CENPB-type domain-containing protein n=1 Tax=Periplaneta americana TaxID=6978 RepID=A0ABQ8TLX5_PERAM|nr:hypothetical protein ANN_08995 [Periplaneta americana]